LPKNGAKVFAIGEDPLRSNLPYWGVPTHMVVPGELRTTLEGLVGRIQTKRAFSSARPEAARVEAKTRIDTRWAAHILNDVLPKNAVVVNETITHRPELLKQLTNLEPGGWLESSFGGLGVGIASALGVKHARPDRTVIVTIGDGAFHYNPVVASLAAAQEHGLPILVLVFDNAGYLSQKGDVANYFPDGHAVRTRRFVGTSITPAPDYVKLAEAYGGCGERVEQPGELRAALERGLKQVAAGRLALVDIVLEPVDP
jgi:acetolactate synthase-1/2/3 large subunit